ncbi:MAG: CBS domain-containing protein [Candidatus Woesearchaeota archaeon]
MVFFSEILRKDIVDSNGKHVGKLADLIFIDGEKTAQISHLVYVSDDKYRKKIPWGLVKELTALKEQRHAEIKIVLNVQKDNIRPLFEDEKEWLVSKLLDKQIIDIDGLKVVRVNDVHLSKADGHFSIVGVCVGMKSFVRRLGLGALTRWLMPEVKEKIIPWDSVEPLDKDLHNLHVSLKRTKIDRLHPSEIADIMEELSQRERVLIFNSLEPSKAAKTLVEATPRIQQTFIKNLKIHRIVSILERITPDQAADIISLMPQSRSEKILAMMHEDHRQKVQEILKYPLESGGALMRTDYIAIPDDYTAHKIMELIRRTKPSSEMLYRLYVVDKKHHLLGVLTIRTLLLAEPKQKVTEFMKQNIIKVKVDTPKEDIAKALAKYNLFVLPVVDEFNILRGVVTADDVLSEVMPKSWRKIKYRPQKTRQKKDGKK